MSNRGTNWCFTINGIDIAEYNALTKSIEGTDLGVFQLEKAPNTGALHVQGFTRFTQRRYFNYVKKAIQDWCGKVPHIELAKGTIQANYEYCTKEETRVEDTVGVNWGDFTATEQGKRSDILLCWDMYKENGLTVEAVQDYPKQLIYYGNRMKSLKGELDSLHWVHRNGFYKKDIILLWGESGTGKTREAAERGAVFCQYASRYHWGHYTGEPVVCFDEFAGQVPIEEVLTLCDGYKATVQIPYLGNKPWIPHTVYFCSNIPYVEWWEKARPEQLKAFWRRVSKCVHFYHTPLGVVRAWQKGKVVPENMPVLPSEVVEGREGEDGPSYIDLDEPIHDPTTRRDRQSNMEVVTADNNWGPNPPT